MQWHDVTRKILGGPLGGQAKFLGGQWPPWHPPSSAPTYTTTESTFIESCKAKGT